MNTRLAIVASCSLVALALVVGWSLLPGPPETEPHGNAQHTRAQDAAAPLASEELEAPQGSDSASLSRREQAEEHSAPIDGFYVSGALVEPDGRRIGGRAATIVLVVGDGNEQSFRPRGDGSFTIGPMDAGSYRLVAHEPNHEDASVPLVLAGEFTRVRQNLVLAPWYRIAVRVRTPEGTPFAREMMSSRAWGYVLCLSAAAYVDEPAETGLSVQDTVTNGLGEYGGIGHHGPESDRDKALREWDGVVDPPDAIGHLRVRSLPVHVALLAHSRRVGSVLVGRNEHEAEFVLDLAALGRDVTGLRLRVIDATTDMPIAGASIQTGSDEWRDAWDTTTDDGTYERYGLAPGELDLRIHSEGHATWAGNATLVNSGSTDLGDVRLEPAGTLRGRVLDFGGTSIACSFQLVKLGASVHDRSRTISAFRGGFEVKDLSAGSYLASLPVRWVGGRARAQAEHTLSVVRDRYTGELLPAGLYGDALVRAEGLIRALPAESQPVLCALQPKRVEVEAGKVVELELQLAPAEVFELRHDPVQLGRPRAVIEGAGGLALVDGELDTSGSSFVVLPLGRFHARWRRPNGAEGKADIVVTEGENVLELR